MTDAASVKEEVRRIAVLVDTVHRMIREGKAVELGRIEARVAACCAAVGTLPQAAMAEVRPALVALLDDFGRLEQTIRKAHGDIAGQLGEATARRRALAAYEGGAARR